MVNLIRLTMVKGTGFFNIITKKGIKRASSDVGFMFIVYNLRRIGNILTKDRLMEYLRILLSLYLNLFGVTFKQITEKGQFSLE